jgi:apolipoprotein N-acyltransferase
MPLRLKLLSRIRPPFLAVISGSMLALSYPGPAFSIFAWTAFVPLLIAIYDKSPRETFKLAFIAGFTSYVAIFYWLNIVMTTYGKLPIFLSISLSLLMAAYLALFVASCFSLSVLALNAGISMPVTLPLFWVSFEYLRAYLMTGFPWALLGYTQYRTLPLIQLTDITGVYGLSFIILFVNVLVYELWRWVTGSGRAHYPAKTTIVAAFLLTLSLGYGFVRLNSIDSGKEIKVALAQGNISQDVKWNPSFQEGTVAIYERLTRKAAGTGTDLVVWPESSLPFFFQKEGGYSKRVSMLAKELNTYLIVSSPVLEYEDGRERLLNSAFLISSDGTSVGRSDKIHLVPFGEYVPLARILPFVTKMVQGIGDFSPGKTVAPLVAPFGKLGILVCFEGIFPEISREYVRNGAGLLVNITNDAWFGDSSAPYQHLSMTVFRAVENRVPLVRSANTGITAFIDSRGHVQGMTRLFREALLTGSIRMGSDLTFYTRFGDVFAWGCCVTSLAVIGLIILKRRREFGIAEKEKALIPQGPQY